ncbi:MAG: ABC transporter permease, partial [Alphaproteobacteria bacterium]
MAGRDLGNSGLDRSLLLIVPGALVVVLLFIYPFLFGLALSFGPKANGPWANYVKFFAETRLSSTIATTFWLAIPATLVNLGLAVPLAFKLRRSGGLQRFITTLLVVPITLGTVLVAEGLLNYLGPQGWFNRSLIDLGFVASAVRLTHNYWGVLLSLIITGFPFAFLLTLSYLTGIDPTLAQAASTLGAGRARQ